MRKLYLLNCLLTVIVVFFASLFYSCNDDEKDSDGDGLVDSKDQCPYIYAKTKNGCPVPVNINKIHFYLETSVSMGGYFNGPTEYKTIVSNLVTKIDKQVRPVDIWFIAESTIKYPNSIEQFTSDIATTRVANQKSTQLHHIISNIASKTGLNDVSVLVSDCILSFPDDAIKANPEINRTEAPNSLKDNIYATFSDLKSAGFGASIYVFKSKFFGDYYNYQNVRTRLNGTSRPFYIWVIAKKNILRKFDSQLEDIYASAYKPLAALNFGLTDSTIKQYYILAQLERRGNWKKISSNPKYGDKGLEEVDIDKNNPAVFNAAVNLIDLPEYARSIGYLRQNLKINTTGCHAVFDIREKGTVNTAKLKNADQRMRFENSTHIIQFTVDNMTLPSASIEVTLPLKYDTSYLNWSCMDDRDITKTADKTFALEYLIQGVREAYEVRNNNYIELDLILNK